MKWLIIPSLLALAACSNPDLRDLSDEVVRRDVEMIQGTAPIRVVTPVRDALACVARHRPRHQDLRIAVSDIVDGTGARTNGDTGSALLTQRPELMFTVGLFQTGITTINRTATRVAEWELTQAMEMRLGEGRPVEIDGNTFAYRPVEAGSILGSTHYVTGALTEVNWNVGSSTTEGGFLGFAFGARTFHINLAADIIVTDTRSTRIVFAQSYQKTLVGREISRGVFRFFEIGTGLAGPVELFDLSIGDQQNEPVHRAVRWLMEQAAYDVASTLTRTSNQCDPALLPASNS
jgi:curli biogenesis system outer membrane secretion channel CsgG